MEDLEDTVRGHQCCRCRIVPLATLYIHTYLQPPKYIHLVLTFRFQPPFHVLSHQSIRKSNDIELSQQEENDLAFTFFLDRRASRYFHGWNASYVSFARQTTCDVSMTRRQRKQPDNRRRTGCWTCKGTVHTKTPPLSCINGDAASLPPWEGFPVSPLYSSFLWL